MQSEPKTFRKRPVVIEAVQWTGKNVLAVYSFMHGAPTLDSAVAQDKWFDFENIHAGKDWHIKTLEDGPNGEAKHVASVGDWIIKGVEGEFYPCKPSVFAATYEDAVSASPSPISADAVVEACADLTNLQKEITLLRVLEAMGGSTDASDSKWSWLNWFCSDEVHNVQDDTFNRCIDKGWVTSSHCTSFDTSTATITKAGREVLKGTFPAVDGWKLVPIEPTPAICRLLHTLNSATPRTSEDIRAVYQGILNLADTQEADHDNE